MYLPATELQTFKGQLICPNCIMDVRDEERRHEYRGEGYKKERYASTVSLREQCERCGRELTTVYFYNGKHLCSTCTEAEKKSWDTVHGEGPPVMMYRVRTEKVRQASLIVALNKKVNEWVSGIMRTIIREDERERDRNLRKPLTEKIVTTSPLGKQDALAQFKDVLDERPAAKPSLSKGVVRKPVKKKKDSSRK